MLAPEELRKMVAEEVGKMAGAYRL
ncbi:hypothetical protein [Desulfonatronum parangueonense]